MADFEARIELIWLMDFYGPLLTEHRREVMRLYCEEDLSLAEIAEQLSITRQGVSDALKKARAQLEDYEEKLGLAARYRALGEEAQRCLNALVDGTLNDGGTGIFRDLHDSIVYGASWHRPDQYFLLLDFERYLEAKKQVARDYKDQKAFARKCWMNICNSGKFSSDRTIAEYAKEIWDIKAVEI